VTRPPIDVGGLMSSVSGTSPAGFFSGDLFTPARSFARQLTGSWLLRSDHLPPGASFVVLSLFFFFFFDAVFFFGVHPGVSPTHLALPPERFVTLSFRLPVVPSLPL